MCEHRRTRTCLRKPLYVAHAGPGDDGECTNRLLAPYDCLRALYGEKRCACTTFRHGLLTGIQGLWAEKSRTTPCGPARYAVRSPTGHWNFGPYGARKLPGSSMWPRQFNCTIEDNDKSTESQLLSSEVFQYTSPVSLQSVPQHHLKCVQWDIVLGGRMFDGSPRFLLVFYRTSTGANMRWQDGSENRMVVRAGW